jgi:hypothetical protein
MFASWPSETKMLRENTSRSQQNFAHKENPMTSTYAGKAETWHVAGSRTALPSGGIRLHIERCGGQIDDPIVAEVCGPTFSGSTLNQLANAYLIAAAPELLAVLIACEDRLCREGTAKAWPEIEAARDAIAKAKGASS